MPDYNDVINALKVVDPKKPYGTELFNALARVTVSIAIEAVCFRSNSYTKRLEVYLTQRSQDDIAYPGQWHCPGSVLWPGETVEDVFERLRMGEFGGNPLSPRFVANVNNPSEARGHFFSVVYLCDLKQKWGLIGSKGKWFPVDKIPENTVKGHRKRIIPAAIGVFVASSFS